MKRGKQRAFRDRRLANLRLQRLPRLSGGYHRHTLRFAWVSQLCAIQRLTTPLLRPTAHDKKGLTPLHAALEGDGDAGIVQALLSAGASVAARDGEGRTPLHCAVEGEHVAAMDRLLRAGADARVMDEAGDTPLHSACAQGSVRAVHALLSSRHGKSLVKVPAKNSGALPLHRAVGEGHVEIVQMLIDEGGANVDALDKDGGDTALMVAVNQPRAHELIEVLAAAGADVNARNEAGDTALHYAANTCDSLEDWPTTTASVLLRHGADPSLANKDGLTAQDALTIAATYSGDDRSSAGGAPSPGRDASLRGFKAGGAGRRDLAERAAVGAAAQGGDAATRAGKGSGAATGESTGESAGALRSRKTKAEKRAAKQAKKDDKRAEVEAKRHIDEAHRRDTSGANKTSILVALAVVVGFFVALYFLAAPRGVQEGEE